MLKLTELSFKLGDFQLQVADFRLPQAEGCWLQGANGAGKSTFLKCVAGIYPAQATLMLVNDLCARLDPIGYKRQVLYISQYCHAYPHFTVNRVLDFCRRFYPLWQQAEVESLQSQLQLAGNKQVRQLSAGMAAKLNLLLAAGSQAKVLLLDEIIAQVDCPSRNIIADYLQQKMNHGTALIYCSHQADVISELLKGRATVIAGQLHQERRMQQRTQGGWYASVL